MNAGLSRVLLPLIAAMPCAAPVAAQTQAGDWPVYGHDAGGTHFSPLVAITAANVARLEPAWTYHTGEPPLQPRHGSPPALETTPLVVDGSMYVTTPLGKVIALDPLTGRERWRYDSHVDPDGGYGDFTNRGVATWLDEASNAAAVCHRTIYIATIDARLIALDARTGRPCPRFGDRRQQPAGARER